MYDATQDQKALLGSFLEKLSDKIDIPPSQQEIAIKRYEVIGEWLASEESPLAKFNPRIVSQGSFRTGTAVKPPNEKCEFDVDLTCILTGHLPEIQKALKELVGKRLSGHCERYKLTLDEKRRCWRIHYAEVSGFSFHLDIVPALPDDYGWIISQGVSRRYAEHAIVITDMESMSYRDKSIYWPKSNTEGYSRWFLDEMKYKADKIERTFSKGIVNALREQVEDVPTFRVRTPLQRAIQLMKRHRDIKYGDHDDKPVSVIITTLASHAYRKVMDAVFEPQSFFEVFAGIVQEMPAFINQKNGIFWVANPVNPSENFADKWQKQPQKMKIFFEWLSSLSIDLSQKYPLNEGLQSLPKIFSKSFGELAVDHTMRELGSEIRYARQAGSLKVASSGILGTVGTKVAKHTFHGKKG